MTADLVAGEFSLWLTEMRASIRGEVSTDVPCGTCTACCTSSQFVHIAPEETDALSVIPPELLFSAPGRPRGHVVLGYDERGNCPMLIDGRCSIYEHRPRTCRTYDCRIFAATGVEISDESKAAIAERVARWQFDFPTSADRVERVALQAATRFLLDRPELLREGSVRSESTLAVLAVEIQGLFVRRDKATGVVSVTDPDPNHVVENLRRLFVRRKAG